MQRDFYLYTERAHLRCPSIHVAVKVTVDTDFEVSRLQQALARLKKIHPLLLAAVAADNDGKAYYQVGAAPKIVPAVRQRQAETDWLQEVSPQMALPFDLNRGPLARFLVFAGKGSFDLLLVLHHIIGDGMAAANLLRDTVQCYFGQIIGPAPQRLIQPGDIPVRPTRAVTLVTQKLNEQWRKEKRVFSEEEYTALYHAHQGSHPVGAATMPLDRSSLLALYSGCKKNAITVNSALVTALFIGLNRLDRQQNPKMVMGIPINIREQLPFRPGDSLGNFASAITMKYTVDPAASFWKNAGQVHHIIQSRMKKPKAVWTLLNLYASLEDNLMDAAYFAAAGRAAGKAPKMAAKILGLGGRPGLAALSNLGRIQFPGKIADCGVHDFVFFPPLAPSAYFTLGAATQGGKLRFGVSYDRSLLSKEAVRSVLQTMTKILR